MPTLDVLAQYLIDQSVLLDHGQAFELVGCDRYSVHASAAAADIFDLLYNVRLQIAYEILASNAEYSV